MLYWKWDPPNIKWIEVKPEIIDDDADKVGYSVTETIAQGKDWDMTLTPEEGTHKYQVKLKANASSGEIKSPKGVKLHRISIKGNHNHDIPDTAGAYIEVPYVTTKPPDYEPPLDEYEDEICKTINPYNGNDCSGLAFCAGYTTDDGIGYTNVVKLKQHYQKGDEAGEENMTLEDFGNNPAGYSGRMWFLHASTYHVAIFCYKNNERWVVEANAHPYDKVRWTFVGTDPDGYWYRYWDGFGDFPEEVDP